MRLNGWQRIGINSSIKSSGTQQWQYALPPRSHLARQPS